MNRSEQGKGKKILKILMVAPTPYFSDRGCHVRIFEEARALVELGHQVRIVTYHLGRDLPQVPVDRILNIPWYKKKDAGPSWHKFYLDLLLFFKTWSVAVTFKPDVLHAHLHEGVFIGWPLAKILQLPILFDYQGSLSGESLNHGFLSSGSLLQRLFIAAESKINKMADLIITSSTPAAEELVEKWGLEPEKVIPLPDGVDTMFFRHRSRADARKRLGIGDEMPLFVYIGLLNRYQGIHLMLEAAQQLIARGRAFHLLVMGFPEGGYIKMAEEMKLSEFVTFTGRVDYSEAPILLSAGDIAISPKISATEANGKLLNYMACGLPVIAFDTPVNRELLGDDGVYAKSGDSDDLALCMSSALQKKETMMDLGERLRDRAVEHHSWKSRAEFLQSLYQGLMGLA